MSLPHHVTSRTTNQYLGIVRILGVLLVLPLLAAVAFMVVEGWGFLDALYMSVITLTTVGYEEVHPLSDAGRILVIVYVIVGLGAFLYGATQVGELVVGMQLGGFREKRKMKSNIDKLKNHVVVCGYGRVGRRLCAQLRESGQDFVVIDRDAVAVDDLRSEGLFGLAGDATDDSLLEAAGLERARSLAVVLPSDADNLYVVLSARLMNAKLAILARATDESAVSKLQRAGANQAINLYETSALKMANLLVNPDLEDFLQVFTKQGSKLTLAEIKVTEAAPFCNKALRDTDLTTKGVLVVGHQKPGRKITLPPRIDVVIEEGDTLIAFGDAAAIAELIEVT